MSRDLRWAADIPGPVDIGQHEIEHQRIPVGLLEHLYAFGAVGSVGNTVSLVAQMQLQQIGDMHVIFDDQHPFCSIHI